MGFEKAIEHGKEHRKLYYDSRAFFKSCRNHGACSYCKDNRLYQYNKEIQKIIQKLNEYIKEVD